MARRTLDAFSASMPLLLISLLLSLASLADATCYYPDGSIAANDRPCTDKTPHSVCCGQGFACLSNGICQSTGVAVLGPDTKPYSRGSCTDKEWRSSDCPLFCIEPGQDVLDGVMGIMKCPNTDKDLYLCMDDASKSDLDSNGNCDDTKALFFPGTPTVMTTIGVGATASLPTPPSSSKSTSPPPEPIASAAFPPADTPKASGSDSSSVVASPTQTVDTSPSAKSTNGAVIGGAVGGALGGVAVIGIVAWLLVSRRKTRQQGHEEEEQQQQQQLTGPVYETDQGEAFEMAKNQNEPRFSAAVLEAPTWSQGQQQPHSHRDDGVHEVE